MLARRIVLVDALTAVRRICACLCLYLYNVCLCLCLCLRLSWYMCAHICPAALHMACTNGQIKVVEALMAKNIPADPLDKYCLCLTQTWTRTQTYKFAFNCKSRCSLYLPIFSVCACVSVAALVPRCMYTWFSLYSNLRVYMRVC